MTEELASYTEYYLHASVAHIKDLKSGGKSCGTYTSWGNIPQEKGGGLTVFEAAFCFQNSIQLCSCECIAIYLLSKTLTHNNSLQPPGPTNANCKPTFVSVAFFPLPPHPPDDEGTVFLSIMVYSAYYELGPPLCPNPLKCLYRGTIHLELLNVSSQIPDLYAHVLFLPPSFILHPSHTCRLPWWSHEDMFFFFFLILVE